MSDSCIVTTRSGAVPSVVPGVALQRYFRSTLGRNRLLLHVEQVDGIERKIACSVRLLAAVGGSADRYRELVRPAGGQVYGQDIATPAIVQARFVNTHRTRAPITPETRRYCPE